MSDLDVKKFGFDVHGVLDDLPETFRILNNVLYDAGHEVHVITGSHITPEIEDMLLEMGIKYTHIFGIADHHRDNGTEMSYDDDGTPWLDKEKWDRTKGDYCQKHGIHLHFDDSDEYKKHFTTPYARVWTKNNRNGKGKKQKASALDR
jgi:hypothetical protein